MNNPAGQQRLLPPSKYARVTNALILAYLSEKSHFIKI